MILVRDKITLKQGQQLIIIPFGDIQDETQFDRLIEMVEMCLEFKRQGHIVRLFGTGDYFETHSPSERRKYAAADFHETTVRDFMQANLDKADRFVSIFKPLTGDVISILQGHHWVHLRPKKNNAIISSDEYIADKLKATFAGDGVARILLTINGYPFKIMADHGFGTGRQKGGRLLKRIRMRDVMLNCNWYVMGHDNEKMVDPSEPLEFRDDGSLSYKKQYFTGVGCFQEAYHDGELQADYAEKGLYPPACIGVVRCTIKFVEHGGRKLLDYEVTT